MLYASGYIQTPRECKYDYSRLPKFTDRFLLLPHKPIPPPALKGFTKHRCLTHFCSLQNPAAQQAQTATKGPATPESHTVHTCFLRWSFILKSKPLFLLSSWRDTLTARGPSQFGAVCVSPPSFSEAALQAQLHHLPMAQAEPIELTSSTTAASPPGLVPAQRCQWGCMTFFHTPG